MSGTVTVMPNKLVRYTPNTNFVGTDTYQYQITDNHPGCSAVGSLTAIATVTITVKAVPTTLSGTVIKDLDASAAGTFNNISTNGEVGTNGNNDVYIYLTNSAHTIIDRTPWTSMERIFCRTCHPPLQVLHFLSAMKIYRQAQH